MTTRINIVVDSSDLTGQNNQQVAENRYNFSNTTEARQIEEEGLRRRQINQKNELKKKRRVKGKPTFEEEPQASIPKIFNVTHAIQSYESNFDEPYTLIAEYTNTIYGRVRRSQVRRYNSFGWKIACGNWGDSITFNQQVSIPAFPTDELDYSTSPTTAIIAKTTKTYRMYRAGQTAQCIIDDVTYPGTNFTQEYGTIIGVSLNGNGVDITPDVIAQCGGPWETINEQFDALLAAAPPLPLCHFYSEVYLEETGMSETDIQVTIEGRYDISWNNTAVAYASSNFFCKHIVIPVGKDRCIVIVMAHYSHAYLSKNYSGVIENVILPYDLTEVPIFWDQPPSPQALSIQDTRINKAYLCSNNLIKEISIPETMQNIIDILNKPSGYYPPINGSPQVPIPLDIEDLYPTSDGFYSFGGMASWSPSVFGSFNELYQFIDPSLIQQFTPGPLGPIATNYLRGYYVPEQDTDKQLFYAKVVGDINGNFGEFTIREILTPPARVPDNATEAWPEANINAAYDWSIPQYCYTMCTALGFSYEDLNWF